MKIKAPIMHNDAFGTYVLNCAYKVHGGNMKKLALVLGGGASKGFAHIGVLQVLEQNGIKPSLIVGNSMGAVIGGAYASGKSCKTLTNISKKLTKHKLMDFNMLYALLGTGIMSGKKLKNLLNKELKDITHEQLQIPFVATATDLWEGKLVLMQQGKVVDSIMASSAIPAIFPSIYKDDMLLCDGGILNNVPDDVARNLAKDHVIVSVDVIADYAKQVETNKVKVLSITVNAMTLMQTHITKLRGNHSDLRINISQPDIHQMNFDKDSVEKSIAYGVTEMEKNLPKLKKLIQD